MSTPCFLLLKRYEPNENKNTPNNRKKISKDGICNNPLVWNGNTPLTKLKGSNIILGENNKTKIANKHKLTMAVNNNKRGRLFPFMHQIQEYGEYHIR